MPRRKLILLFLGCTVVVGGIALLLTPNNEPRYNGRALSGWLDIYCSSGSGVHTAFEIDEAADAVRHIGTNALPWLLRWLPYEYPRRPSIMDVIIGKLPISFQDSRLAMRLLTDQRARHSYMAQRGFELLGPKAKPVIPELLRLTNDPKSPGAAAVALYVLSWMGKDGSDALFDVLNNDGHPHRDAVVQIVGSSGIRLSHFVPVLARLVTDKDQDLATASAGALGRLALEPAVSVPALTNTLGSSNPALREDSVQALGGFGAQASCAIPLLRQMLEDPDATVREYVTNALQRIAPDTVAGPAPQAP